MKNLLQFPPGITQITQGLTWLKNNTAGFKLIAAISRIVCRLVRASFVAHKTTKFECKQPDIMIDSIMKKKTAILLF